ncbi:LacI family DNA-binding transcriptional regulator [Leifsonia sp. NPDC058230]|uniref:LacI family DNA-binding transcriptional regulator n=1 Tax=Leifsonia sp. NPDC058230 TaxID=3346391 RepID=UPI0036DF4806
MKRESKRPTITDVAEAAGLSKGTVSRVLNGGHWVSPDSRAAVEAAIKKTRYRVNPHARNLAMSRANTVAFLLTEGQRVLFEDPNFATLVRETGRALAEQDLSLVLIVAGSPEEQSRALNYITAGHVDGVLLGFSSHYGNPLVESLLDAGVPVVASGQPLGFEGRLSCVSVDEVVGARTMVEHLRSHGRSRIAFISGPADTPGGVGRLEGYRRGMGDLYDERLVASGDYRREAGEEAMRELLRRDPDIDAVFAANDAMAAGAVVVLQESGRRVPEDVMVGGFDDSVFATQSVPQLTTMQQPFARIGSEMVRLLLNAIAGEQPASLVLSTRLVERASTAAERLVSSVRSE